jgi:hypothetical protein
MKFTCSLVPVTAAAFLLSHPVAALAPVAEAKITPSLRGGAASGTADADPDAGTGRGLLQPNQSCYTELCPTEMDYCETACTSSFLGTCSGEVFSEDSSQAAQQPPIAHQCTAFTVWYIAGSAAPWMSQCC